MNITEMKNLNYPVYDIERSNQYTELIKNVQKLNELQGPHYDIPDRSHHFSEIYRSIGDLKEMNAPVYDIDYKHTFEPDLRELVGPNYHVNTKHSYGHDFAKDTLSKESHGPVFKVERKHGYGADFSVRHRTASPCAGPVLNVERKHHYKAPLTQPHQRDLRAKSSTPTYEVSKSHHSQKIEQIESKSTKVELQVGKRDAKKHWSVG